MHSCANAVLLMLCTSSINEMTHAFDVFTIETSNNGLTNKQHTVKLLLVQCLNNMLSEIYNLILFKCLRVMLYVM